MVLRFLMRYLLNDKAIDKLANSYPVRRAAQWTVYFFLKGKEAAEGQAGRKALQFKDKFSSELKKEWEKMRDGKNRFN